MNFERQLKYYYLKLIGLRDEPHELALGIALGIFTGMMPIIPLHWPCSSKQAKSLPP